jgi:hypothetical protein
MWYISSIIFEVALGILISQFLALLVWDLVGLMPAPWNRPSTRDEPLVKAVYRLTTFLAGCVITAVGFFWAGEWFDIGWSYLPLAALLGGFSVPIILIFLARLFYAIMLAIFRLYARTEVFYDRAKTGLQAVQLKVHQLLRKKGLAE